jgi:hypothetical protein
MMTYLGKALIGIGILLIIVGGLLLLSHKVSFIGRLPGDIYFKKGNFTFYFPLATCILISIILSVLLWLFGRR